MTEARGIAVSILSQGQKSLERRHGKHVVVIDGLSTLEEVAAGIRTSSKLERQTVKLRGLLAKGGREGPYRKAKREMPAMIPASCAPKGTAQAGLPVKEWHNGLYGYDIDEQREDLDLDTVRAELIAAPGACMVGTSCAGDALYAIFAGPAAQDEVDYKRHWAAIAAGLPPAARVASGEQSKNFNRLRFLVHDPDVWLASGPVEPLAGARSLEAPPMLAAPHAPQDDDHAKDAAALAVFLPPDDYNSWVGWLATLKARWFSVSEVEAWSAQGAKYQPGEVEQRWNTLPEDSPEDARRKLRGHAYNLGWREQRPSAAPPTTPAATTTTPSASMRNEWFVFAEFWEREHGKGRFRYVSDPAAAGWWAYIGNVWRQLLAGDNRIHDELARYRYKYADELVGLGLSHVAEELVQGQRFSTMVSRGEKGDLWVGLRAACAGPLPTPELHHIGTPSGIWDTQNAVLLPHDPKYGIRGLTAGSCLPTAEIAPLYDILDKRLGPVLPRELHVQVVRLVALALTGRAQGHTSIVLLKGLSGSGKGGVCNLVRTALGDLGKGVGAEWIAQQTRSDIDAILADILERQIRALHIDEIGGDTRIGFSRLFSLTGAGERSARRPHGVLITGTPIFQIWTTCVDVPAIPKHLGIERRLAVFPTLRELEPKEKDHAGGSNPELLDAVVTLACHQARKVYLQAYEPPVGSPQGKAAALAEMDKVSDWLESQEDLDGVLVSEARIRACADLDIDPSKLSATAFGSRVSHSTVWAPHRQKGGARGIQRR